MDLSCKNEPFQFHYLYPESAVFLDHSSFEDLPIEVQQAKVLKSLLLGFIATDTGIGVNSLPHRYSNSTSGEKLGVGSISVTFSSYFGNPFFLKNCR
jgi:hypothetical protein